MESVSALYAITAGLRTDICPEWEITMSGNGSKWLMGCGIGCGAAVLLLVALGTFGYLFVKSKMRGFVEAESASAELTRKYGRITDYCPDPGGPAADRIRVFLDARDKTAAARGNLEVSFASLSDGIHQARGGQDSIPQILDIVARGFSIVPQLGEFHAARTRALMDEGMGPGEYVYIYVLVYYSWMGKSPADGPGFRIQGDRTIVSEDSRDGRDARQERRDELTRYVRRTFLDMLRNRCSKTDEGRAEAPPDPWRKVLDAEISALEENPSRIPWQDGLPKGIEDTLQPFRQRLEDSYSPLVNPLELGLWARSGKQQDRSW